MTNYDAIRLVKNSVVVAYLAPNFTVKPAMINDLKTFLLARGRQSKSNDIGKWGHEIVAQGVFAHSDNLPADHKAALIALFGVDPVTPKMQINRVKYYALTQGGAYDFYDDGDEYTATSLGAIDIADGVFPTVFLKEVRPSSTGGLTRMPYTIRLVVSFDT